MTLDLIQNKEYLRRQIFKTPAKILLNSLTGYYFLTEDRAKNYFEHVISMISLQSPDRNTGDICEDLINKYSSKLETDKSKGEKKENISVIMFLLFIMVALLFIGLFVIATWYKSLTPIYFSLLVITCVIFYFTSVYGSLNNKKVEVLESVLSSLEEIVQLYNSEQVASDEEVAQFDVLNILKFMSDKKYIALKFDINAYTFNVVSDLSDIPLTNIVRILHILEKSEKIEILDGLIVTELAKTFTGYFKNNGGKINTGSFETTFNEWNHDETRYDLNKIQKKYRGALFTLFQIKSED